MAYNCTTKSPVEACDGYLNKPIKYEINYKMQLSIKVRNQLEHKKFNPCTRAYNQAIKNKQTTMSPINNFISKTNVSVMWEIFFFWWLHSRVSFRAPRLILGPEVNDWVNPLVRDPFSQGRNQEFFFPNSSEMYTKKIKRCIAIWIIIDSKKYSIRDFFFHIVQIPSISQYKLN